ncbi:HAD-IA family hydrolase [Paenibacillus xylaniclasticus]|uniref:HAD-IA family hydrolase n=1 Tax=Paenibacillus xylaniclasticus TaxID=588083 RepID=UPI000FD7F365|nr:MULTISPECIES: HAD-IA family hydrolase [Paenibacillus]GFN31748.1 hypothetical protein PCURB6_20080 [Paenibacillus curdlanolyticus]
MTNLSSTVSPALRPQLVLDVGGVLLSNLTPAFWTEAVTRSGVDYAVVRARYKSEIRDDLWSGVLTEEQFWSWIAFYCPSISPEAGQALLMDCLVPLPALTYLHKWSRIADLHLLSNHRHEWLLPKLEDYIELFRTVTISSQSGCFKPNEAIYRIAEQSIGIEAPILFVDDSTTNLQQAELFGWSTLLADVEGKWISKVEPLLAMK